MGKIFDGKLFAQKQEKIIKAEVERFKISNERRPKLASIYNPEHLPSRVYTNIKAKKALELNILFEKYSIQEFKHQIHELVPMLNADKSVDGVMVQVPLGNDLEETLIGQIDPKKDIDGLQEHSQYLPATVRAVAEILKSVNLPWEKLVIVGSRGVVGSAVMDFFHREGIDNLVGMDSENFEMEKVKDADVIISATGVPGLITAEMVKDGVIAIDVGYPKGDFDPEVSRKASFMTPVPGGVGPVTVVSLYKNLLKI